MADKVGRRGGPVGTNGGADEREGAVAAPPEGRVPSWVVPCPAGSAGGFLAALDPATRAAFPVLHDFMTQTDVCGKPRRPGSLSLFCEDGMVKAALSEREKGLVSFLSAKSVLGLLEGLERGLREGTMDWRPSKRR